MSSQSLTTPEEAGCVAANDDVLVAAGIGERVSRIKWRKTVAPCTHSSWNELSRIGTGTGPIVSSCLVIAEGHRGARGQTASDTPLGSSEHKARDSRRLLLCRLTTQAGTCTHRSCSMQQPEKKILVGKHIGLGWRGSPESPGYSRCRIGWTVAWFSPHPGCSFALRGRRASFCPAAPWS